jgi:hypothetical protein
MEASYVRAPPKLVSQYTAELKVAFFGITINAFRMHVSIEGQRKLRFNKAKASDPPRGVDCL